MTYEFTSTTTIAAYIEHAAEVNGVDKTKLLRTLNCESRLNPRAVGDNGTSFGVAQIHLPAHPEISREQALDPQFAIDWAAGQFADGNEWMWTCYSLLFGKNAGS